MVLRQPKQIMNTPNNTEPSTSLGRQRKPASGALNCAKGLEYLSFLEKLSPTRVSQRENFRDFSQSKNKSIKEMNTKLKANKKIALSEQRTLILERKFSGD